MTTCTELSDRMPDVAQGRSRWTEPEAHHLATCADCRAEWALVSGATRLGASLTPGDPALVATLLLERLARERELARRLRRWTIGGLAAAAAVIFVVWTSAGWGPDGVNSRVASSPAAPVHAPEPGKPADTGLPLPEIDDLPAEVLDSMLQVLDEPVARADAYELPVPDDSGDRELEQALTGLEG